MNEQELTPSALDAKRIPDAKEFSFILFEFPLYVFNQCNNIRLYGFIY